MRFSKCAILLKILLILLAFSAWNGSSASQQSESTVRVKFVFAGHKDRVDAIAFKPNSQVMVCGSQFEKAKLWDLQTNQLIATLDGRVDGFFRDTIFSNDGKRVAIRGAKNSVYLYDTVTGQISATLIGHKDDITSVMFSADDQLLLTGSFDNTARLWSVADGKQKFVLSEHKRQGSFSARFSPDGQVISTACGDKAAKLWNAKTGQLIATLSGHTEGVFDALFSADSRTVATAGLDGLVMLWNAKTGAPETTLQAHKSTVYVMVFSPNGRWLATASRDGTAGLWNIEKQELQDYVRGFDGIVTRVAFSTDSRWLAASGGYKRYEVGLMEVKGGEVSDMLKGHKKQIEMIAFSPDGRYLVSADNKAVKLWNPKTGKLVADLASARHPAAFSLDGKTLATAGKDDTVILWDLP